MNIRITKSSYKTKENKRAIIFDCSAKNYRKKINTGILVEEEYFEETKTTLSISLNITFDKLKSKKEDALAKYFKYNWSKEELETYLKKGIELYSIEEYVTKDFVKNKNLITANDYQNVVKVFKKHLNKTNIHFNDILEENTIHKFKYNAEKRGVKSSSINSYIKKMSVIMNQAKRDGFITKKFVIPRYIIEKRQKLVLKKNFDKNRFIRAVNESEDIFEIQALSIFLMLLVCGGMSPSNLINYKVIENKKKKDLISLMLFEKNSIVIKFKKSNKGEAVKYVKLDYTKIKIIELVKTLFYLTHHKKYPFILSAYSSYHSIFNFDIQKNNNFYRNFWNFFQVKIKEKYDLKFSDAKSIYYQSLKEIEMNKVSSDVMFSKVRTSEIITLQNTDVLKQNIEKYEQKMMKNLSASELTQVIINRLIFLGVDLNKFSLNDVKTPSDFSAFLHEISKFHTNLKN